MTVREIPIDAEAAHRPSVVDRRRVGKGGTAVEPSTKPSFVEELEGKVTRMEAAFQEKIALLEAETARSRARLMGDLEKRYSDREEALLMDVLELLDDLSRASALAAESPAVKQGLDLVAQRSARFLEKHGCSRFDPEGEPFDPNTMEAVQLLPGEKDRVVAVFLSGLRRGEKLLRPARVAVGAGTEAAPGSGP